MDITPVVYVMGLGRIVFGLAPIVFPTLTTRVLRSPTEHDNATARLMGRLFGVRESALGVLVIYAVGNLPLLRWVLVFQAAIDGTDALCNAPLLRDPKMRAAAIRCVAMALGAASLWLVVRALV